MGDNESFKYLEWEYSEFPIKINELTFENSNWGFSKDSIIEIWRNENFKLEGKIYGVVKDFKKIDNIHFVDKGNIVKGQAIKGLDSFGNTIQLEDCFLGNFQTSSINKSKDGYFTEGEVQLDSIKIRFTETTKRTKNIVRYDWFLCNKISAHFVQRTFRKANQKRIRVGLDNYDDSIENLIGSSSSKDYEIISIPNLKFIIAKVPENILDNHYGLCFEFREKAKEVSDDLITGISSLVSFILGDEIKHIGHTLASENLLIESTLENINSKKTFQSMPPIKFNNKYDWGNFSWILNRLLPNYLELRYKYQIEAALSRYWISRQTPLGANLPLLASSLEIIAENYLKTISPKYQNEYLTQKEYLSLIKTELSEIQNKLSSIEGSDIIINKITNAFRKGVNEKMNYFLKFLEIQIGKSEKEAIALRNKMVHSSRDYSDKKKIHDDLIYSRVYEVLFNRVILKLLNYKGYYIDYSIKGCPSKKID